MYSLDKTRMSMLVQNELTVKLRNRAKEKGAFIRNLGLT